MTDPFDGPARRGGAQDIDENGIRRNQWGQPVIEGKNYVRATTMAGTLADKYAVHAWRERMLAHGMTVGTDEIFALASMTDPTAHGAKKTYESQIIEPALDRAGANAGHKKGTSLHLATHRFDAGATLDQFPEWARKSLAMYRHQIWSNAIGMQNDWIEVFTACDEVGAAGTADRILSHQSWGGKLRVGDLKTQKDHPREYNALEIAVQLAIYAHGLNTRGIWRVDDTATSAGHWDTSTVGRMDLEHAVVMWLPVAGEHAGKCELVDIDIAWGWTIARMSERVRAERKVAKSKATTLTFGTPARLAKFDEDIRATQREMGIPEMRADIHDVHGPVDFPPQVYASPMTQDDKIDAAFAEPATHLGQDPSHGGLTEHKGRIEDCQAPDHEQPYIDYAGKMCPDGRVHGPHDGCPGRKKRSPAQIRADAQAAGPHAALAEMSKPVSGPGIDAALAAGEAQREVKHVSVEQGPAGVEYRNERAFTVLDRGDFIESRHELCGATDRSDNEDVAYEWREAHQCNGMVSPESAAFREVNFIAHPEGASAWPIAEEIDARPPIDHTDPETDQDEPVPAEPAPGASFEELAIGRSKQELAEAADQVFAGLRELRAQDGQTLAAAVDPVIAVRAKIKAARSRYELSRIWHEHQPIWTQELTDLGQKTMADLGV